MRYILTEQNNLLLKSSTIKIYQNSETSKNWI